MKYVFFFSFPFRRKLCSKELIKCSKEVNQSIAFQKYGNQTHIDNGLPIGSVSKSIFTVPARA